MSPTTREGSPRRSRNTRLPCGIREGLGRHRERQSAPAGLVREGRRDREPPDSSPLGLVGAGPRGAPSVEAAAPPASPPHLHGDAPSLHGAEPEVQRARPEPGAVPGALHRVGLRQVGAHCGRGGLGRRRPDRTGGRGQTAEAAGPRTGGRRPEVARPEARRPEAPTIEARLERHRGPLRPGTTYTARRRLRPALRLLRGNSGLGTGDAATSRCRGQPLAQIKPRRLTTSRIIAQPLCMSTLCAQNTLYRLSHAHRPINDPEGPLSLSHWLLHGAAPPYSRSFTALRAGRPLS